LGIFQENVVNRVLRDVVKAANPVSATVVGDFAPRGGLGTIVTASWSRKGGKRWADRDSPRSEGPRPRAQSRDRRGHRNSAARPAAASACARRGAGESRGHRDRESEAGRAG